MNCLFSYCFNDPVIENTMKQPLTNSTIITIVDELEEVVLEKILEPVVNDTIQKITGQDISGVINTFVRTEVEPTIESVLNNEINIGLLLTEKMASPMITPIIKEVETNIVPIMNQVEIILPELKNEIETTKSGFTDISTLLTNTQT